MERRLDEVEMLLESMFRESIQGIIIHQDSLIQYANPAAAVMFGYQYPEELIGTNLWHSLVVWEWHAELQERAATALSGKPIPLSSKWKALRQDGSRFWCRSTACQVTWRSRPALMGFFLDVTDERRAEDALRDSEYKYRLLVEHSNDAIWVSQDAKLIFFNPRAVELLDRPGAEIPNLRFEKFIHPDDLPMVLDRHWKRVRGEEAPDQYEVRIITGKGEVRWLESRSVRVDWEGRPATLAFAWDVTSRKRAEEEQERMRERLAQGQKMEAVGRLAGGVAHDFNNLLSIILGYSAILKGTLAGNDQAKEALEEIEKAAERASNLTRQLLAFGRKQVLEMKVVDLNAVVDGFEKFLRRVIGENIVLKLNLTPDLLPVMADVGQLEQVLMNLAVNARDAMPGGGQLTIQTTAREINEASARRRHGLASGRWAMVSVEDTGCGMDRETRGHIFEPFFTTKEKGKGTGLGLATTYGIIEQHEGTIEVRSAPDRGAVFKIYLPLSAQKGEADAAPETTGPPPTGSETVLLVEDSDSVRRIAKRILAKVGYTVIETADVDDAIAQADVCKDPIHLVLSDMVMPKMNGIEVCAKIRELHPEAKALFMSGYAADVVGGQETLPEDFEFIEKPFTVASLAEKVRAVLDQN